MGYADKRRLQMVSLIHLWRTDGSGKAERVTMSAVNFHKLPREYNPETREWHERGGYVIADREPGPRPAFLAETVTPTIPGQNEKPPQETVAEMPPAEPEVNNYGYTAEEWQKLSPAKRGGIVTAYRRKQKKQGA